jgi:hypothetical protein
VKVGLYSLVDNKQSAQTSDFLRLADGNDQDVGLQTLFLEIGGARVTNGRRRVMPHEQSRRRRTHDLRSADHHNLLPLDVVVIASNAAQ